MKKILFLILISIIVVSCSYSGWSLREQGIIKKIPISYQSHVNGIIKNPSQQTINEAISFGRIDKDGDALQYAYLTKTSFGKMIVYSHIYTPLRLIAEHSKNCSREYNEIDSSMVNYLSKMNAVKIDVIPQYTSTNTWNTYAYEEDFFLLRDGIRVPTLTQIKAVNRNNPFDLITFPEIDEIQKKAMQNAMQYTQLYTTGYTREQKIAYCKQLKMMGLTPKEIVNYSGFPADSVNVYIGNVVSNKEDTIYFTENDNIFSIDELNKPGFYEIIFRTPQSNNLLSSGDLEKRIPISFERFK